jgi:hypothetical protein
MVITEDDHELMEFMETEFGKLGIMPHGVPLGIGVVDITTNSEHLNDFIWCIKKSFKAAVKGVKLDLQKDNHAIIADLQGLEDEEVESDWEEHRFWTSSVKYKGSFRQVRILKHKTSGAYRSEITPISQAKSRAQMLLTTSMIRGLCNFVQTETVARQRLEEELDEKQKRQYALTDSFAEIGKSGVLYMLRRNRPTLAFRLASREAKELEGELLCGLCMHPLAYYTNSWAGVMPPSDEILAHLFNIRADEHRYWKICNQHPGNSHLSGL